MKAKDFEANFKRIITDALNKVADKETMQDLGEAASELIKKRTRLGYGVDTPEGSKKRLKPLSDPYKKKRKKDKPTGPTTPTRSNLTSSGKMLDNLGPVKPTNTSVSIGFSDKEQEQKAEWVSEERPFNNLSKSEVKQIEQELVAVAEKAFKDAEKKLK